MTKTNIRKRAISILLILMVMLTMTPMTASAADGFVEVSTYEELKNEVNKGSAKIKLMADIDTTSENSGVGVTTATNLSFKGSGNVLDLNGHKLKLVANMSVYFIEILQHGSDDQGQRHQVAVSILNTAAVYWVYSVQLLLAVVWE